MSEELISVIEVAQRCGKRKQTVFRVLKRLGIEPEKLQSSERHGQVASYISRDQFDAVRAEIQSVHETASTPADLFPAEFGVFYLVQLEPEHDPQRFKVGFASNMAERLRSHRTSAPYAAVLKTWPCRSLWEKTLIDCIADGCERLHTEVFRAEELDQVIEKCDEFFALMPKLVDEAESLTDAQAQQSTASNGEAAAPPDRS